MRIEAYLFFPGTAEEAMGFYRDVFGGELTITRRGDVDPSASDAEKDQVINAILHSPDLALRANDAPNATRKKQDRVALSVMGADEGRLRAVFDALAGRDRRCAPGTAVLGRHVRRPHRPLRNQLAGQHRGPRGVEAASSRTGTLLCPGRELRFAARRQPCRRRVELPAASSRQAWRATSTERNASP